MTDRTDPAREAEAIRATVEGAWSAIGAKDAEKTLSYYAPDLVQFAMAPPLATSGPDAKALRAWFETWRGPIGHESRDWRITIGGDIAFCSSLFRMTGTKQDGAEVDLWFRATVGLRKSGGRWLIVHEHESVPFHMDGSFKAAIDLRP